MSIGLRKPQGLLKWALKLPIKLYHAGLGSLLGHRFMLLRHRGRKSGRVYETVLEVPYHSERTGRSYVISGWSDRADWLRNTQAGLALRVQTGSEAYRPLYHVLSREEVRRFWSKFQRRHPLEEWLSLRLMSTPHSGTVGSAERREALVNRAIVVAFQPAAGSRLMRAMEKRLMEDRSASDTERS